MNLAPNRQTVSEVGVLKSAIDSFLSELRRCDRSPLTIRSYELGLRHFQRWLASQGIVLDNVTKQTIGDYILFFRESGKDGAIPVDQDRVGSVNAKTGKSAPSPHRKPRTVNHRLSVLSSFFAFLIDRASETTGDPWASRQNPVPQQRRAQERRVIAGGRDLPRTAPRAAFRMRIRNEIPKGIKPELAEEFIQAASSARDKAILALLLGSGQRIGDWQSSEQRHGVLGMRLVDVSADERLITVSLKGSRAEHRVPTSDDFWPLLRRYLREERPSDAPTPALWVGFRRGTGRPLNYAAFERSLRMIGEKLDANVNAHMFRHTLAQLLVDNSGLAVAQKMLGHSQITTTTVYARATDEQLLDAVRNASGHLRPAESQPAQDLYAFPYDKRTLGELDSLARTPRKEYPDA